MLSALVLVPVATLAEDITAGQYTCSDGVVLPSVYVPSEGGGPPLYVIFHEGRQLVLYSLGDRQDGAEVYWQSPDFSGFTWQKCRGQLAAQP